MKEDPRCDICRCNRKGPRWKFSLSPGRYILVCLDCVQRAVVALWDKGE